MSEPRRRLSEAEKESIAELRERGLSYEQIGRKLNCSAKAVSWHCLRLGAEPPGKPSKLWVGIVGPAVIKRGKFEIRRFTPEEDARILAMATAGQGDSAIAKEVGRRPNSIRGRLMTLARRDARAETSNDVRAA